MKKGVIITGGTGLIGQALAASLIDDEHEVIVLSRSPELSTGLPDGVRVERWDARTAEGWSHLVDGTDAIINLAGENISAGRWTATRKRRILESRLNAGRAIAQAVESAAHKPRVLIQASGIGYYGLCDNEEITEETPAGKDFLAQLAVEWEDSTARVEAWGVRRAIVRTGVVLSSKGGALPRMLLPFRLFLGGRLGSGQQWLPWIHMADEVGAIRFLIDNDSASGPFNLTAPNALTNTDFSCIVGQQLRRPAFMPVPAFVLRFLFGEMATLLLYGQRAVPQRLLQLGFTFKLPTADSALQDILQKGKK
ncbi:MAG TPA: TIGR01777 family oxidoreductase [Dehalococcoidia bacterium]|nr:TIGR01777 family oxidoreductase [Dehalococcoidia bacterium]